MDLFSNEIEEKQNLLHKDGIVNYYGKLMPSQQANYYFERLLYNITWTNDVAIIFGKRIVTKRKVAWYGEKPFKYTYSKTTKSALFWTKELLVLKKMVEQRIGETFNSCLLNMYHNGNEGMAWHSDGETDLKKNGAIASLSFGAERKFAFKHKKTKENISLILENGGLLVMKDTTQTNWLHRLPLTKKIKSARINLTFRTIVEKKK